MGSSLIVGLKTRLATSRSTKKDVRRGRCCACLRQWLRHVQGRLRRRRRPQGRLPLHRWTSPPPGCDGRYGTEGCLRRRRGPVQEGYPHPEVPRRARHHHQLGRHGEDLAPHLLQRAPRCPRGAARPPHRGPPQPQGQQGEDDPDHVRDLQHARHVRRHPGCALPVRLWPYHRYRHGLRRRCLPRRPRLRGLRSPPRHPQARPCWPGPHRPPHEDPHREGLLLHHHCREGDREGHQGEAVLRRPGLRAGDGHRCLFQLPREVLRASRRPGDHHRQREVQVSRGSLPAQLPGNGVVRYPRDHLQLHHEVRRRYQEGPVRQHCPLWRHHHVPRNRRQNAEGDHRPGSLHHEDQDHRSPREEVLRLDRRLHPGFPLHLPAGVDLQAGVRRVRPLHRPPQVLLIAHSPCRLLPRGEENNILDQIAAIFIYLSVGLFPVFYSTIFPSFGHSAVYNIPSSTLIFTFFLQDISLRDFCTFINCLLELS